MKPEEQKRFKKLCSFKKKEFDADLLRFATPTVLGHLFFNRMQAVAYGTLEAHGLLGAVNREFRNSLKVAYEHNKEKNESFFWCVQYLEQVLSGCKGAYAMLKGAYLCKRYPIGYRTSNDIDLLVHPKDVTVVSNTLLQAGFSQGNIRGGKFEPASRKEIIESKMMRGETVPFIKEIKLPGMPFLEVDVNFSLDYKPRDTKLLEEMLNNTVIEEMSEFRVRTLKRDDFFIHLCCHLHKEATTLPWIEMMRDMTLYKYCDIYLLLNDETKDGFDHLMTRAKELGVEKICAFAVIQMSKLFDFKNTYAVTVAEEILRDDPNFIHTVISPREKKTYVFANKDIANRFFANSRKEFLREETVQWMS